MDSVFSNVSRTLKFDFSSGPAIGTYYKKLSVVLRILRCRNQDRQAEGNCRRPTVLPKGFFSSSDGRQ